MKKNNKKEKPPDRRVQKTKSLLSNALVALIIEKGYENVSIKDIVEKANVGRSTFYAHFEDKEQLLLWGHNAFHTLLTAEVRPQQNNAASPCINFLFLYEHIREQRVLITALMGEKGGEIAMEELHNIFVYKISERFEKKAMTKNEQVLFTITVHAAASAMIALLVQWTAQNMSVSTEEMARYSNQLLNKMFA